MFEQKFNKLVFTFLGVLFLLTLAVIIITINEGFDFTDEGGFLLSYKEVNIYRGGIYNYHLIITRLTDWLNPGIIGYRIMGVMLTMLSSFVLAFGLHKWLNEVYPKKVFYKNLLFIFCFISIGNFIFHGIGLQTIHNNTLTNAILHIATGLILYLLSYAPVKLVASGLNKFILFAIGFLCAFSFFVKFSTGILQFGSYLLIVILYARKKSLKKIISIVFILFAGFACGLLTYFSFFQSYAEWIFNFKKEYIMLSDHSPGLLFEKYKNNVINLIRFLVYYFSWLAVFPLFILFKKYFPSYFGGKTNKHGANIVLLLLMVFFLYEMYHFGLYRSSFANNGINAYLCIVIVLLQIGLLVAIGISKNIFSRQFFARNFNRTLIITLLLISPFFGALGTANPIFLNASVHSATWFGVILILLIYLSEHVKSSLILSLFILTPGLLTTLQIIDGNTFVPYYSVFNKNKSNYFQQTEQVQGVSFLKGIFVDIKTKTFLEELNAILYSNGYKKRYPIFGFNIPGIVYLLDGISPGMPYYFNFHRDNKAFECFTLQNNAPIIMITEENPINDTLLNVMKGRGVIFPDNYLQKGELYFPYTDSKLKVYFPKTLL